MTAMADMQVKADGRHYEVALKVVWPLVKRSARFGPYFWVAAAVMLGCGQVVGALMESNLAVFLFSCFSWGLLGDAARQADIERVFQRWADEVANG